VERVTDRATGRFRGPPCELPEGLSVLADLALDLGWTWSHAADALWGELDAEVWRRTANPWLVLQEVSTARLLELGRSRSFQDQLAALVEARRRAAERQTWFAARGPTALAGVAYFCMEFGLGEALPLYAGGLGVLAGDHLKTASELGVPVTGVGLLYQEGYFRQLLDGEGRQLEAYPFNDTASLPIQPALDPSGEWVRVELHLPGRAASFRVWRVRAGRVELLLLDSNDPMNAPSDRGITGKLYGGGTEMRFRQELALGLCGVRALEAVGCRANVYHLNEGHAAFALVERARRFAERTSVSFEEALVATRAGNVFTTHTPVAAGFDAFQPALVERYLRAFGERAGVDAHTLLALGRRDPANASEPFHMAYLALRGCGHANGVSRLHGEVSRRLFSGLFPRWPEAEVPVEHVTNGVHTGTWDSRWADDVWTRACGKERWRGTLDEMPPALDGTPDEALWTMRAREREALIAYARVRLEEQLRSRGEPASVIAQAPGVLDPNALTVGFARRFVEYKRPTLLLSNAARLARLLGSTDRPVQLVVAGKAHPDDSLAKDLIHAWIRFARRPDARGRVVFLEDYDITLAQRLVQGVDLWLNTPRPPLEACGTSGMKVLVNGGLNVSTLDGWWAEAYAKELGWAIAGGDDGLAAQQLYELLEGEIVPEFYDRDPSGLPRRWIARMRASMAALTPRFSSNRMLREYVERFYEPAARAVVARTESGAELARQLVAWRGQLAAHWHEVHTGDVRVERRGESTSFRVPVYLGEIGPESVRVELYADATDREPSARAALSREGPIQGAVGGWIYVGEVPASRPPEHFTPRVVPCHEGVSVPLEATEIFWAR
jgi:starch phosphorylase